LCRAPDRGQRWSAAAGPAPTAPLRVARHCGTRIPRTWGTEPGLWVDAVAGSVPGGSCRTHMVGPVNHERQPACPLTSKVDSGLVRVSSTADPPRSEHGDLVGTRSQGPDGASVRHELRAWSRTSDSTSLCWARWIARWTRGWGNLANAWICRDRGELGQAMRGAPKPAYRRRIGPQAPPEAPVHTT
jgi:hypothetical protein